MRKTIAIIASLTAIALVLLLIACEKEKIVESTEYVHDIEYVQLPPDTVFKVDTVFNHDTTAIQNTDTVIVSDTVVQDNFIYDTVLVEDTLLVYDTVVTVEEYYDTVVMVEEYYDTVVVTDTVETDRCSPNESLAITAMQYHCDPIVIQAVNYEFGYTDGWIFYLSAYQLGISMQSSEVYDIHGYIDYWTPDWSAFCAFEFYWRMTYTGGDPADPTNWQMTEPPTYTSSYVPGVRVSREGAAAHRTLR